MRVFMCFCSIVAMSKSIDELDCDARVKLMETNETRIRRMMLSYVDRRTCCTNMSRDISIQSETEKEESFVSYDELISDVPRLLFIAHHVNDVKRIAHLPRHLRSNNRFVTVDNLARLNSNDVLQIDGRSNSSRRRPLNLFVSRQ
jgi:hypothetical protein